MSTGQCTYWDSRENFVNLYFSGSKETMSIPWSMCFCSQQSHLSDLWLCSQISPAWKLTVSYSIHRAHFICCSFIGDQSRAASCSNSKSCFGKNPDLFILSCEKLSWIIVIPSRFSERPGILLVIFWMFYFIWEYKEGLFFL